LASASANLICLALSIIKLLVNVPPDVGNAALAVVAAASAASLATFTEAPVAARVVLVLVAESTN